MSAWICLSIDGKADHRIVPPRPRIPWWKGPGADSEEKQEPASDIDIVVVDSLKALDPKRPIREEADIVNTNDKFRFTSRNTRGQQITSAMPLKGEVSERPAESFSEKLRVVRWS